MNLKLNTNDNIGKIEINMDYTKKTRDELIIICKEQKINGYSGMNKTNIIQLINSQHKKTDTLVNKIQPNEPTNNTEIKEKIIKKKIIKKKIITKPDTIVNKTQQNEPINNTEIKKKTNINIKDKIQQIEPINDIINKIQTNDIINNISPLRYPGGKTRACLKLDTILNDNFNIKNITTIISPFFGGGSFEFYLQNKYNFDIICNDKFKPLYSFWNTCKNNKNTLTTLLYNENLVTKEEFTQYRNKIMLENDEMKQAFYYFIINRCSFSGATLSGGFSTEASKKRFTTSSIDRIKSLSLLKFQIYNMDFEPFINENYNKPNTLLFLDPPYYLEKASKLYGNNGDMHDTFDHQQLFNVLSNKKNWIVTYNHCKFIKA
jgi:DNA adenine methylase